MTLSEVRELTRKNYQWAKRSSWTTPFFIWFIGASPGCAYRTLNWEIHSWTPTKEDEDAIDWELVP